MLHTAKVVKWQKWPNTQISNKRYENTKQ
jgi:hypothetical protein